MKEQLRTYIVSLIDDVPHDVYEGLLAVLCAGIVILLVWKGWRAGKYIVKLMFMEYIFLLYSSTVLFRPIYELREYNFAPFWSYKAIEAGRVELLAENIMNVMVFVPVGLFLGIGIPRLKWGYALLIGFCLSSSIEILQFVFKKGFSETDDVMHNTLGCMIGYGIFALAQYGYNRITMRDVGALKTRKNE